MAVKVFPPSRDRYVEVFGTYTISGSIESTLTSQKYHPRPQIRASLETRAQFSPPSSERYNPPSLASAIRYIRFGLLGANAIPIRPSSSLGSPCLVNNSQCSPPSFER